MQVFTAGIPFACGHAGLGCMRPCRISRIEAMAFGLCVNFHNINANLGLCENTHTPKKWGRREYVMGLLQILSTFYTEYFPCPFAVAACRVLLLSRSITSQLQCTPPEISTKGVTPGFVKWCLKLPNFWLTLSNGNRSFIHSFTKWMGLFSCVSNILV